MKGRIHEAVIGALLNSDRPPGTDVPDIKISDTEGDQLAKWRASTHHYLLYDWTVVSSLIMISYLTWCLALVVGWLCFHFLKNSEESMKARISAPLSIVEGGIGASKKQGVYDQIGYRRSIAGWVLLVLMLGVPVLGELLVLFFIVARYDWFGWATHAGLINHKVKFESLAEPFMCVYLISACSMALCAHFYNSLDQLFLSKCPLKDAPIVVIMGDGLVQTCYVKTDEGSGGETRSFEFVIFRYVYEKDKDMFCPSGDQAVSGRAAKELLEAGGIAGSEEASEKRKQVGLNTVNVEVPGVLASLIAEFMSKTSVYQLHSISLFAFYDYWNVATLYLLILLLAGIVKSTITRNSRLQVQALAGFSADVQVVRGGALLQISSSYLVPGDLLLVTPNSIVPCDCALARGGAVVCEAMLTGEPMPVTKLAMDITGSTVEGSNMLYMGTEVLDASGGMEGGALAVVKAIGGATQKANLIRLVLFPSNVKFKFNSGLAKTYIFLVCYSTAIFCFIAWAPYPLNLEWGKTSSFPMLIRGFFTVFQTVNPMFGVALAAGRAMAQERLRARGISCLAPERIPVAGSINTMVLDKTGTITKDGMELHGVQLCDDWEIGELWRAESLDSISPLVRYFMVSCHKLSMHGDTVIGSHVEVEMFKALPGWALDDSTPLRKLSKDSEHLEVGRLLDFDHARMTSGCVCKLPDGETYVFVKGAAATIASKCKVVPREFVVVADKWSSECFYVLGCGMKKLGTLDMHTCSRDDLEADLSPCALLLFKNELKPDSQAALKELHEGGVNTVLCTGDHLMTGISVAKKTGIIPEDKSVLRAEIDSQNMWGVALVNTDSGERHNQLESQARVLESAVLVTDQRAYEALRSSPLLPAALPKLRVFGRMQPTGKVKVVEDLQQLGRYVGMCGDGGNDCGALRAAHAGLALSAVDASIVAPFSSGANMSLYQIVELLKEGRACLATNIASHSYYLVYGLCFPWIKTAMIMINGGMMAEVDYIWLDVFHSVLIPWCMTSCRAADVLSPYRPSSSLFGVRSLLRTFVPHFSLIGLLTVCYQRLFADSAYMPWHPIKLGIKPRDFVKFSDNFEVGTTFLVTVTHLTTTAVVLCYGGLHRQPLWKNWKLHAAALFVSCFMLFVLLGESTAIHCLFRINCDSETSHSARLPQWLSALLIQASGNCFNGPQMEHWHDNAQAGAVPLGFLVDEVTQKPRTEHKPLTCVPSDQRIQELNVPVEYRDAKSINNIFSEQLKWFLVMVFVVYAMAHHIFQKFVVMNSYFDQAELKEEQTNVYEADESADV